MSYVVPAGVAPPPPPFIAYDAVSAYDADVTVPAIRDAVINDAVVANDADTERDADTANDELITLFEPYGPTTLEAVTNEAVLTNDALTEFNTYDAVVENDAVVALDADVANELEIAVTTYDAVLAKLLLTAFSTYEAVTAFEAQLDVPNKLPVTPADTFKEPVMRWLPETITVPIRVCVSFVASPN